MNNKDDKDLFNNFARPFPGEGGGLMSNGRPSMVVIEAIDQGDFAEYRRR